MNKTLLIIRIFFFCLSIASAFLLCLTISEWDEYRARAMFIGGSIGALVILVDILIKGFSLRGMSAITFGLFVGWLMSNFIAESPLFERGDENNLFLARLALYIILMYLCTVIALRGKDEFNLVIPYMRFVPHGVEVPLVVVDTSALIDGRIVAVCESKFLSHALVIPRFVIDELHRIADSSDPQKQAKGRKGLEVLNLLNKLEHTDIRIHESDLGKGQSVDDKLVFLAQSIKSKILTTDYNLARIAEFHSVEWLNLNALAKALSPEVEVGETLTIDLVKAGKEQGQAVGFLSDGSMVIVNDGYKYTGKRVEVEVISILPSAGGKMIFAKTIKLVDQL